MADYVGTEYTDVLIAIRTAQRQLQDLKERLKDKKSFDAEISARVDTIITSVADLDKQGA